MLSACVMLTQTIKDPVYIQLLTMSFHHAACCTSAQANIHSAEWKQTKAGWQCEVSGMDRFVSGCTRSPVALGGYQELLQGALRCANSLMVAAPSLMTEEGSPLSQRRACRGA